MVAALLLLYLALLSAIPALLNREPKADLGRAHRAISAENWSLVTPDERAELGKAIDQAWRSLRAYQSAYRLGTPAQLAANQPLATSDSAFNLGSDGRIQSQHDTNLITAAAPGSDGKEQRFEGYRVLTDRPYLNDRKQRVGDAELIYQQSGSVWSCQRGLADKDAIPPPALRLAEAGDGGFSEIEGRRVRAFLLPAGAFGLRSPATVWVDVDSLLVRRQMIDAAVPSQQEVWTYSAFDQPVTITPPSGVTCVDD